MSAFGPHNRVWVQIFRPSRFSRKPPGFWDHFRSPVFASKPPVFCFLRKRVKIQQKFNFKRQLVEAAEGGNLIEF